MRRTIPVTFGPIPFDIPRWPVETWNTHLSLFFGELAPTLKDVSMILALPIRGESLVPRRVSNTWAQNISDRLGMTMPESQRTGGPRGIPLPWLHDNFRNFSSFADSETRKRHLFAYLLWLLGVMFPNSHGDVLLPGLIYIVEKMVDEPLPEHPKYSFGSAILSHTYRGLCDATQKTSFAKKSSVTLCPLRVSTVVVLGIPPCRMTSYNKSHTPIRL